MQRGRMDGDPRRDRRVRLAYAAAIVAVTAIGFAGSVGGDFVSDDVPNVRENPRITSLSPSNVVAIFRSFDDANYVPIKVLSLAVDRRLFGPGPAGHHVTNVVLHAVCAVLVFAILLRLGFPPPAACLTATLWAV